MKKAEEFNSLRESIKKRIDDLDAFFEDNFDNEFITYFEKGRIKLKKIIQYEPNLINEIDNGNNMKAFILGQNSKDNFFEQDDDINNNYNINYFKKNKNNSKSCKIFPGNNLVKTKTENNYLNKFENKSKVNNNSKRILKTNYDDKNKKWQKDLKNRIYNNYYNQDIRKKYSDLNSEDSGVNSKHNKVKYMDWTENNSIQGNTISVKSNKISNSTHSYINIKKKVNNVKFNNLVNNDNKGANDEKLIDMNFYEDSNYSKSSKSKKRDPTEGNELKNLEKNIVNKEILFEIKLTKEEYNMLVKQKTKKMNTNNK